jgi:EmrB/QacA subfamily drug resistance transporter
MTDPGALISAGEQPRATDKRIVLFIACIALFFLTFMLSAVNIALPAIGKEFDADAILLSWLATAPILIMGVLLIPAGRLADIIGIRKMFTWGMILYTLIVTACAFSTSIQMLIILRAVMGISTAMTVGNAIAMVSGSFKTGEKGRALGLTSAAVYAGLSVGPFLGGILTEHLGWRSIFMVNVPCTILIIILLLWKIKDEWYGSRGERFDLTGSIIFSLALTALLYGFSVLTELTGVVLVLAGILGLWGFVRWENSISSPVLNVKLFKNNRTFLMSNLASLISYAATSAVVFLMSFYLQYIKGLSAETAGLILIPQPIIQACLSPVVGRLSDKIEPQKVSSAGMAVTCLGLILFGFIGSDTSIAMIIAILIILGIGFALFISPNTNAIMSSVSPQFYGVASAMASTMRQIGQMFSMGVTMMVMTIFMGRVVITSAVYPAFITSTRVAFIIFAALCFGGIFASLARGKVH